MENEVNIQNFGYTEMYEWMNDIDLSKRSGKFVTFNKENPNKIQLAHNDDFILGVTTVCATSTSDDPNEWKYAYLCNEYGDLYLKKEKLAVGGKVYDQKMEMNYIRTYPWEHFIKVENQYYDKTKEYVKRSNRQEWFRVNLVGKAIVEDNGKEFGHERTILDIQDSKYNINGLYAFDPTWDSAKDIVVVKASDGNKYLRSKVLGNLKDDDIILHEYDNIVRYGYFLIGKDEYKDVFKNEAPVPDINRDFNNYYGDKNDEITTQLSNKTLSIDNFIRLMATVKKEEGYSKDALKNELIDIVSFNRLRNELYNGKSKQVDELNNMISELEEQNRIKNDDSIKKQ